ncbi:MAG: lysylphosphatidylglycerol synthase domain-containing protein, partial [Planctomycetota bacterium]|nr:lysylphosphatidylglycerol synthase domain-containing protein [Planctomycetota bacterium]
YFAIVPIANIISSIPVLPGGWGFGELAYLKLFELIGASGTQGTAVSITFRLCQLLLSLLGGLFLLAPGAQVKLDDLEAEVAEAEKANA